MVRVIVVGELVRYVMGEVNSESGYGINCSCKFLRQKTRKSKFDTDYYT
jgi:hypothetical protein